MSRFVRAGLYLVTSESMSAGRSTIRVVTEALKGGVRLIQLREKDLDDAAFLDLAVAVRRLTAEAGALLLINDRIDVAESAGADGVHLGLDDTPVRAARERAPDMIIGASSHSLEEALAAQDAGASYVNIGPVYPTRTKSWSSSYLGVAALNEIAPHLSIPWTVMGGIKKHHVPELVGAGARTVAVVTAVTMAPDIEAESREWLKLLQA